MGGEGNKGDWKGDARNKCEESWRTMEKLIATEVHLSGTVISKI